MAAGRDLFGYVQAPATEGIKYAGSKLKLLPYIVNEVADAGVRTVLDAFSGTTRVAQAFAQLGYAVTANDRSVWSEVFGRCYLHASKPAAYYKDIIDHLNGVQPRDGWFAEHYGSDSPDGKRPFRLANARKLDAVREEIDNIKLDYDDKCVALTSLILALDSVDNTIGHYAAYLSGWAPRAYNDLVLKVPRLFARAAPCRVLREDAFDAVGDYHDLVYLDPPYGSNNEKMPPSRVRYAAYYHLWTTIVLNDRPELFGRAGRRTDSRDQVSASVFEEFRKGSNGRFIAMEAIDTLIAKTNAHYIMLSYSSGGRATKQELYDIINSHGQLVSAREIDYKTNVMASLKWTNEWARDSTGHKEYLFLMEKR